MNPSTLPKGPSIESDGMSGQAKAANMPGIYRHPQAGKEVIVLPDPISRAQQDALVRLGFEWVGEAPSRTDLLKMQSDQAKSDAADEKKGLVAPGSYDINPEGPVYNGTSTDPEAELAAAKARIAELEAAASPQADATPAPVETPADETVAPVETATTEEAPETPTNETKET